jgi:hypothetical protein
MTSLRDKNYSTLGTILASAVADSGTFTVAYPTGTTQDDFARGLANLATSYVTLNDNDKVSYGTSGVYIGISFGASNITITNHSGFSWAAGTKVNAFFDVKDGNRQLITIPLPPLSTLTAADVITEMYPGINADLEYAEFVTTIAVTTASKLATLNFEIGTTDVTGMTLGLTSATVTPKGTVLPFGLPTAGYTLSRSSKLSLEASAVTAFVEGEGYINLYVRHAAADQY